MTNPTMNHEQAVKSLATERYLLGEMADQERSAFEEHYLECPECLEAVTFADEFLSAGAEGAKSRVLEPAAPSWAERLASIFRPVLHPAPVLALLLLLVSSASYNAYQAAHLRSEQKMVAELKAPRQEYRFKVRGESRGEAKPVTLSRTMQLSIEFSFASGEYPSGVVEIVSQDGKPGTSLPVSVSSDHIVQIALAPATLSTGRYTVTLYGISGEGTKNKLAQEAIQVVMN